MKITGRGAADLSGIPSEAMVSDLCATREAVVETLVEIRNGNAVLKRIHKEIADSRMEALEFRKDMIRFGAVVADRVVGMQEQNRVTEETRDAVRELVALVRGTDQQE